MIIRGDNDSINIPHPRIVVASVSNKYVDRCCPHLGYPSLYSIEISGDVPPGNINAVAAIGGCRVSLDADELARMLSLIPEALLRDELQSRRNRSDE